MDAHGQLPVASARVSHFVDAETCEFPSLSMVPWYRQTGVTLIGFDTLLQISLVVETQYFLTDVQ